MPPIIEDIQVPGDAEEHLWRRHGVTAEEAREAAASTKDYYRTYPGPDGAARYVARGRTDAGRRLVVVLEMTGGRSAEVITAYEPLQKRQRTRHRRGRRM